ncbi:MAG TPA: HPF/RaiA family ribosome-associated protein [Planctomycetota bacterium]|nr:HPF/RaiA family ribosome-associated protein [Planctomycetota bacterium]
MAKSIARTNAIRAPFARDPSHAEKKSRGRASVEETPLSIVTPGVALSEEFKDRVRAKLGAKLGKYARNIERVTVRFVDLNGPKRGIDTECRVKVSLHPLPTLLVSERGINAQQAFDLVCDSVVRAVHRSLERAGFSSGRAWRPERVKVPRPAKIPNPPPSSGSRYDRRVGRTKEHFLEALSRPEKIHRDKYVDTSQPGISETDRKAGGGSTVRRNSRKRTTKATVTLEDSATGKPSRKSTRKSANRRKGSETLEQIARNRVQMPQSRASAERVHRK